MSCDAYWPTFKSVVTEVYRKTAITVKAIKTYRSISFLSHESVIDRTVCLFLKFKVISYFSNDIRITQDINSCHGHHFACN